jgi:hypothetical protein
VALLGLSRVSLPPFRFVGVKFPVLAVEAAILIKPIRRRWGPLVDESGLRPDDEGMNDGLKHWDGALLPSDDPG